MKRPLENWRAHFIKSHKDAEKHATCLLDIFNLCGHRAINSHSISKTQLKLIANNNHVKEFSFNMYAKCESDFVNIKSIGINRASGFPGFCPTHDADIFKNIDSVEINDYEKATFPLYFRAIFHEFYKKITTSAVLGQYEIDDQERDLDLRALGYGYDLGARDLLHHMNECIEYLSNNSAKPLNYVVIKFAETLPFAASFALNPQAFSRYKCFEENDDVIFDSLCVSVIPQKKGTLLHICWPKTSNKIIGEILNLLSKSAISDTIFGMTIDHCENMFICPDWYEQLDSDTKQTLKNRFHDTAGAIQKGVDVSEYPILFHFDAAPIQRRSNSIKGRLAFRNGLARL